MLQVKNLTITHRKDNRVLLKNFNLVLNNGDRAAIIGEEGNGKSTLLKLIYEESMVEDYVEFTGEIIRNNSRMDIWRRSFLRKKRQKVFMSLCAGCLSSLN